jgi:hypothetical protein
LGWKEFNYFAPAQYQPGRRPGDGAKKGPAEAPEKARRNHGVTSGADEADGNFGWTGGLKFALSDLNPIYHHAEGGSFWRM